MKGRLFYACARTRILHGNETCALNAEDLRILEINEVIMFHWMSNVSGIERVNVKVLSEKLGIRELSYIEERTLL